MTYNLRQPLLPIANSHLHASNQNLRVPNLLKIQKMPREDTREVELAITIVSGNT